MSEPEAWTFRHLTPEDQPAVLAVLDDWWGGLGGAPGPTQPDYDGPGLDRVLFSRAI